MPRNTSENLSNKWHQTPLEPLPHHQPTAKSKPNKLPPVIKCPLCTDKHNLVWCQPFAHYDVDKRNKFVWEKRLCTNCLGDGHGYTHCPSKYTCRTCHNKHHTMLYREKSTREATNTVLCVKVQPHNVDSDKADSDVTIVETAMVAAMSGSVTPEGWLLQIMEPLVNYSLLLK